MGVPVLTLQNMLGSILRPLVWTFGVPWKDSGVFGSLLGQQVIATEFVAYLSLGDAIREAADSVTRREVDPYTACERLIERLRR